MYVCNIVHGVLDDEFEELRAELRKTEVWVKPKSEATEPAMNQWYTTVYQNVCV